MIYLYNIPKQPFFEKKQGSYAEVNWKHCLSEFNGLSQTSEKYKNVNILPEWEMTDLINGFNIVFDPEKPYKITPKPWWHITGNSTSVCRGSKP